MLRATFAMALMLIAGCADVPEVALRESDTSRLGDYPALVPMSDLLAGGAQPARAESAEAEINARAARLRGRAAALRQREG